MDTIKQIERRLYQALLPVKCFCEFQESAGCWLGGTKKLYGRHLIVGLSLARPHRDTQRQLVRIFRKYYHSKCKRFKLTSTSYGWNRNVKSELVILF